MKQITACLIALSLSSPAHAEDTMTDLLNKFDKLSKNAQTLLEGWVEDIGPKLEELGPALEKFADSIEDMSAYHPPEVLENGDIIIRRKKPSEVEPEKNAEPKEPAETIEL